MSRTGAFIVSGAGSGIGRAVAAHILARGHHVFGLGRDPGKLADSGRRFGADGARFSFAAADLSLADGSARAVGDIRAWLTRKDLLLLGLVNNAGVFDRVDFLHSPDELWRRHFDNNLLAAVRLTRELHAELKTAAPSSVLNISSTLGLRPVALTSAYSAIKAAMINWTQSLALEWAPDSIRCNCVCPGLVDTPIHTFHAQADSDPARARAHAAQPLGHLGTPEDIARAAWFLLSEDSNWTTGAVLTVDGGINL
jgi:NAD(P)-dependent dehydrogenase (short-subunit alcohol dehydrogenase family)